MERLDVGLCEVKFAGGDEAPARAFSGYGAVFENIDSYGDTIAKGAFKRSLRDHKKANRLPAMLSQHGGGMLASAADLMPIGVWTNMAEDDTGLVVEGRLSDTPRGNEAYTLLKDGALTGLSIGFMAKQFSLGSKPEEPRRTLKDLELLEVSLVTFPANGLARVADVKSVDDIETLSDAERLLREAGSISRRDAVALVSRIKAIAQREAGASAEELAAARLLTAVIKAKTWS